MADVGGPISSLPGTLLKLPEDQTCDEHPDRLAVVRIQGETDSFGYEAIDWCQECYDKYKAGKEAPDYTYNCCDHCHCSGVRTTKTRDPDEGSCGPVYDLCDGCLKNLRDYHNDD